ncbi:FMRFamide receptor [Coccinella septempunctata]|uniref:FMRFamide receptor n=1 Tax=Coccinella septempunctata TaxID=41139 RepID=UPI001D060DFC|nr:FMRFamide receptor [Coccinella septempunctata]XP_044757038.1 FMRFamide receptor [Coccinella septempunctata]
MLNSTDAEYYVAHNDSISNDSENASPDFDSCLKEEPVQLQLLRFIINGLLLNIIGVLGMFGNIISMIILSRPQMRSSINYLLIGLARIDTVLILTSMLLFGLPGLHPYSGALSTYYYFIYPHIVPVVYPLALISQAASAYLTFFVSLERFVAVCHPLKVRSLCTYGRARFYVIGIICVSALYNISRFWESSIQAEWWPEQNITVYCPSPSYLRRNPTYRTIYIHWCYFIFIYLIPFMGIAVLNAMIYRQIRRANRERQRLSRLQKREIGLATMLFCVVAVFFICNLPPMVINIIETFGLEYDLSMLINISNLLVTINSSVNFIIYVIFGEKFKRLFLVLFCHNSVFGIGTGRESPDGTHDDSFISNGDRTSVRLHRQFTNLSRNGNSSRMKGSTREKRCSKRAPSPGPCVYYPANRSIKEISAYTTQISLQSDG